MRKLLVFESISVDGYFADAQGELGWAHAATHDPQLDAWVEANASMGGELLFGRKTYQMMEAFWPTAAAAQQMPVVAQGMNAARKHVASRTLQPTWNNTQLLEGELIASIRSLKSSDGPGLTVLGSGSIVVQLADAGLVDEYQLLIVPVALGAGRTIFNTSCKLRLLCQRAFRCGNIAVTYAV